jgi:hypothetical protein
MSNLSQNLRTEWNPVCIILYKCPLQLSLIQRRYINCRNYVLPLWLCSPLDFGRFFGFLILYTVGRTPWRGDQPVERPLPTHKTTQTQNKRTQTFMPQVGFEPTTPKFKRAKTGHALDSAATVIGIVSF